MGGIDRVLGAEALAATRAIKNGLVESLARAGDMVATRDAAAFRAALDDYYTAATEERSSAELSARRSLALC